MITKNELYYGIVILALCISFSSIYVFDKRASAAKGLVRTMQAFGLVAVGFGIIEIILHLPSEAIALSTHARVVLKALVFSLGGFDFGMILALFLSGQVATYLNEEKVLKKTGRD